MFGAFFSRYKNAPCSNEPNFLISVRPTDSTMENFIHPFPYLLITNNNNKREEIIMGMRIKWTETPEN